ncbi:beta-L-arabinofuranosidase domain-containing protein [Pedobacter sp. N36a]|uniref:beta-L-arabinofuranosidase domain-containing protein n=1 Tax=Pedobacter sp. N36a TaxID=2767996 RepID=UPI00210812B7|nr:beta-L-arabinofuranosidase domain-containing protein [Pedobacter sp. N36a]
MNLRKSMLLMLVVIPSWLFAQSESNGQYIFNRTPLNTAAYVQLPLGSIKAKGWLLKQLQLQKDGATGNAEALYPESGNLGTDSDWLGGTGESWERAPYYVKGLVALAYTLGDPELKAKSEKWINWTLDHQQPNGAFGPIKMTDWWPRMPMMYAIQSYYEATADKRVIPFFSKYFKYQLENLDQKPLYEWSKSRTADNIEIVLWLYNRTGEKSLLVLAEKLKSQAYPWAAIFTNNQFYHYGDDFHTKHSVSVGQALKFPSVYSQLNNTPFYREATQKGIDNLMRDHGQSTGIASGTEFLAGRSSFQGTETCTVVEWMQSLETAARIIHDAKLGDRLEKIAFNTLPAQFSRDIKSHLYYTQPNQVRCKHGNSGFDEDYDGALLLSPYSGMGCCRYNMHMGWPYFVKNSWAATPDKGLAVIAYAPVEVNAFVADGTPVQLQVMTDYPFEEEIKIKITLEKTVRFPLKLRIPEWCKNPLIVVNGKALTGLKNGQIYTIDRTWNTSDLVSLNFPMEVKLSHQVNNSVTVERGPIVYGLQMDATYSISKKHPVEGFYDYEVVSASAWNYGLVLTGKDPTETIKVQRTSMPENPFIQTSTPVKLTVKAKKIPSWTMAYNSMHSLEVPRSPVVSSAQTVDITLTPFGSENIRISNFPVIGAPENPGKAYKETFSKATLKDWLLYGGSWFIKDGAIHAASNKGSWGYGIHGSKAIASNTNFKDLSYEAKVQLNSSGDAGLMFRVTDHVIGADAYNGYYVGINAESGQIQLGKSSNQKWIVLASAQQQLEIGKSYPIRIEAKGADIKVYFNNALKPILAVTDGEFSTGSIGVRAFDALASITDLQATSIKQ